MRMPLSDMAPGVEVCYSEHVSKGRPWRVSRVQIVKHGPGPDEMTVAVLEAPEPTYRSDVRAGRQRRVPTKHLRCTWEQYLEMQAEVDAIVAEAEELKPQIEQRLIALLGENGDRQVSIRPTKSTPVDQGCMDFELFVQLVARAQRRAMTPSAQSPGAASSALSELIGEAA